MPTRKTTTIFSGRALALPADGRPAWPAVPLEIHELNLGNSNMGAYWVVVRFRLVTLRFASGDALNLIAGVGEKVT